MNLVKLFAKNMLKLLGWSIEDLIKSVAIWSIKKAATQQGYEGLVERLRKIKPDISGQEPGTEAYFNDYYELKRRVVQAFQCTLMLRCLEGFGSNKLLIVDIGDSAGTHMLYLRELTKENIELDTISVNLDPRAIERIKASGLKAILCRAEDLDFGNRKIDLFRFCPDLCGNWRILVSMV